MYIIAQVIKNRPRSSIWTLGIFFAQVLFNAHLRILCVYAIQPCYWKLFRK